MPIKLNSTGGGSVTLDVGSIGSTFTLTAPANNGTLITSATGSRLIPSAAMPVGSVLQVVHGETRTTVSTTSSGSVWSGVSITPSSTSSKILILASFAFGGSNLNGGLAIYRNGAAFMSNLDNASSGGSTAYTGAFATMDDGPGGYNAYAIQPYTVNYLDSPSSISSQTYSLYCTYMSGGYLYLNRQGTDNGGRGVSTMTLIEIAG